MLTICFLANLLNKQLQFRMSMMMLKRKFSTNLKKMKSRTYQKYYIIQIQNSLQILKEY